MCVDGDDVRDERGASRQVGRRGEASGHGSGELHAAGVFGRRRLIRLQRVYIFLLFHAILYSVLDV